MVTATTRVLVVLLCGILLLLRVAGAHLHICLDGQEPRVAAHVFDGGLDDRHAGARLTHLDQNIDDGRSVAAARLATLLFTLPPGLVLALVAAAILSAGMPVRRRPERGPCAHSSPELRPPHRGPPPLHLMP